MASRSCRCLASCGSGGATERSRRGLLLPTGDAAAEVVHLDRGCCRASTVSESRSAPLSCLSANQHHTQPRCDVGATSEGLAPR
jgi:hypothetical protein